uniref:Uncharacterized protein n=1 Tax=viral metagenome TaxID=1070528 RepID=A0A6M3XNI7_9ZZZZ
MEDARIELQIIELRKEIAQSNQDTINRMTTIENRSSVISGRITVWGAVFGVLVFLASGIIGWHINQPYHYGIPDKIDGVKREMMIEIKEIDRMVMNNRTTLPVVLSRLDAVDVSLIKLDRKLDRILIEQRAED